MCLVLATSIGPVQVWKKKGGYIWQAAIDRTTSVARSLESSEIPKKSRLHQLLDSDGDLHQLAKDQFSRYPVWLCRFPVTFGALQAVVQKDGCEIRDRLFGIKLLAFGKARTQGIPNSDQFLPSTNVQ